MMRVHQQRRMDASKVMLVYHHTATEGWIKKYYVPIRIQCVNALENKSKYNEFGIIHP